MVNDIAFLQESDEAEFMSGFTSEWYQQQLDKRAIEEREKKIREGVPVKTELSNADEKESELKAKCMEYCRLRGWLVFTGSMAHKAKRTAGEPDMIVLADAGRVYWIELKVMGRKQEIDQLSVECHMTKLGHLYQLVRSLEQFQQAVNPQERNQ